MTTPTDTDRDELFHGLRRYADARAAGGTNTDPDGTWRLLAVLLGLPDADLPEGYSVRVLR